MDKKKEMPEKNLEQLISEFEKLDVVQAGKNIYQNKFHEFDIYDHTMDIIKKLF